MVINKLKVRSNSLMTANKIIAKAYFTWRRFRAKKQINYIDYENPSKNSFIIIKEFKLKNVKSELKKSTSHLM